MPDLVTMSGTGPELPHEGKVYRLSLFTVGVRARWNQWARRQYMSRAGDAAAAMAPAERKSALELALADVMGGKADFGYVLPADRGKDVGDPTRTPPFTELMLETHDGLAAILKVLLEKHHPDATEDLASEMLTRSNEAASAALAAIFPKPPAPAANG